MQKHDLNGALSAKRALESQVAHEKEENAVLSMELQRQKEVHEWKDSRISLLTNRIGELEKTVNDPPENAGEMLRQLSLLSKQIKGLQEANKGHQEQNSLLAIAISQQKTEKDAIIRKLERDLEFLSRTVGGQNRNDDVHMSNSPHASERYEDLLEEIKSELFSYIVLSVKLSLQMNGRAVTADTNVLYDRVRSLHMPYKNWPTWVSAHMNDEAPNLKS